MGRRLGGPAERKGGEMSANRVDALIETSAKVLELWDWVGERIDKALRDYYDPKKRSELIESRKQVQVYAAVRYRMRTLFAGLIDFDSEERKTDERL